VTPEKSKVAETLDEYRGQYAYNLLDDALRDFAARVPQLNQWDDHEVLNNWYPGEVIDDMRYTERRVDVLAPRARRAFFEWLPITPAAEKAGTVYRKASYGPLLDLFVVDMRTFKDPNDEDTYADPDRGILGAEQLAWLKDGLVRSKATWKVLAIDLPLGLVVPDGEKAQEAVAQGDPGAPLGRELQFAELLRHAHAHGVTGIVMLTADVHYTAAHHYDPSRGKIGEFTPFWEFVSGPLNAGAFGPNQLDATFGPEAVFVSAPPTANTGPWGGYQFFGQVSIDAASRAMTVRLRDIDGKVLFEQVLEA
jgi:alkaline phosphatase D